MEFGLRALMNEMFGPPPAFPREYMENIPTASAMRKKTYRRQPLRAKVVRNSLMKEQELDYPDIPPGMDPGVGGSAPKTYTGYSSSKDFMPGDKLVGTGAIGPGGKQLTPQQIKYPNATRHRFSGIPIPKLRDFFGRRRTR